MSKGRTLPLGWASTTLAKVVRPPRPKIQPDSASELPFIGMDSIDPGSLRIRQVQRFADMKSSGGHFLPDDVLYGRMRPYLNKVARPGFEGACSAEFIVFPSTPYLDSRLLAYLLHGREFVGFASSKSSGDRPRVDLSDIGKFPFLLPPRNEQGRIADKIDALFSDIEGGERALEGARKLLDRYRQAVLKAAVSGELTKEWRANHKGEIESGDALLTRILKTRREAWEQAELAKMRSKGREPTDDSWKQRYKQPAAPQTAHLMKLPDGWVWMSVEQVSFVVSGQTPNGFEAACSDAGEFPWFKVSSMNEEGNETYLTNSSWRFDDAAAQKFNVKILLRNTIVFPKRGGAILTNKKRKLSQESAYDLNLMGIVPVASLSDWLWLWFGTIDLRKLYDGANVPQINAPDVAPIPVPVPPAEERAHIVELIEDALSVMNATSDDLHDRQKNADSLRQSTLTAAFAGKLVPQDPSDEPASALLDRIRAERTAGEGPRTRKRVSRAPRSGRGEVAAAETSA